MKNIQAALFDLDGTLTNTLTDIANAMNRALTEHGLPTWSVEDYKYLVGNGAKILAQRAVRDRQELAEPVRQTYQAWYETHNQETTRPYDGIPAMLTALRENEDMRMLFSLAKDASPEDLRQAVKIIKALRGND